MSWKNNIAIQATIMSDDGSTEQKMIFSNNSITNE